MSFDVATLSPWLWVVAPLIIVVAYTVFGLSGFGSTVIAVPILAHFLPVGYLVPLMAVLDLVCAAFIGRTGREHVSKAELKRILPFAAIGFILGITLLVGVADRYLRLGLGVFTVAVGLYSVVNPVLVRTISAWWAVPAGIAGGVFSTLFGAGGPVYVSYFSGRLRDKSQIRSTVSTLISISAFSRVVIYSLSGLLLKLTVLAGLVLLSPFVWIGLKLGGRIHVGLTQEQMRRFVGGMLVLTGGSLVARSLL